jgi:exosortase A-associated hydrolase 2
LVWPCSDGRCHPGFLYWEHVAYRRFLLGCGDSSGDFCDASWDAWRGDVVHAVVWVRQRTSAPLTLWGLRAGCLLASNAAVDLQETPNFIFWQPVLSGKQHWQQFMRLKAAAELASGRGKEILDTLRQQVDSGESVEIAGYTVGNGLTRSLEKSELVPPYGQGVRVAWFELTSRQDGRMAPASLRRIDQWRSAGYDVEAVQVEGPAFWQTSEIENAPLLLDSTLAVVRTWQ